jgi:lysophospholipase L1-like esterase
MFVLEQYSPLDVLHDRPRAGNFPQYARKFLAQGDSWFSFGSANALETGSLLDPMEFATHCCVVNCAHPGDVLAHMVEQRRETSFLNLPIGGQSWAWDAILLSAGGNDLIDFLRTPAVDGQGRPVAQNLRALLTKDERGAANTPEACISEEDWATFVQHIVPQFHEFVALRDSAASKCQGVPYFAHTYDFTTPHNAGAGLGAGPWLYPSLVAYGVPQRHWIGLTRRFLNRLAALMKALNLPNFHVIDTQGTLVPADLGSARDNHDWANEIHPNRDGYPKLAEVFAAGIAAGMP